VVFMDCHMPEMDGFEATSIIRKEENERERHTAIIALTADAMTGDREKCIAGGMDDYLNKPLKAEQITDMLHKWVPQSARPEPPNPIGGETESAGRAPFRMSA
ncbi:MAG: response regulator, partial [Alphaproteobacteria bacterium]